jgi:hypothetical protein
MRPVTLIIIAGFAAGCGRTDTYMGVPDPIAGSGEPHCDRDGGVPLLQQSVATWGSLDACIEVTYEVEAEPLLNDLRVALSDWTFPGCTWLCFVAPEPREDRPLKTNDRRLHLGLLGKDDHPADGEVATTRVQVVDGAIINASILIAPERVEPGKAPLLTMLGQALGFEPTPGVDSVLNDRSDVSTALTPADQQSVCAAYPTCR